MQTGDLVLFRGSGPIPWVIRKWTRSAWGHCGILLMLEGVAMVIEARYPDGVSVRALANRMDDRPDVYPTGVEVNAQELLRHAGDNYSCLDAIRAGIDQKGDSAGFECAELCAFALGLDHDSRGWTPQNLAEAIFDSKPQQELPCRP